MAAVIYALLITAAYVGVILQLAAFVGGRLRAASGCSCVKGGWDFNCPVHGRDAA